jgi:hypothetical protein
MTTADATGGGAPPPPPPLPPPPPAAADNDDSDADAALDAVELEGGNLPPEPTQALASAHAHLRDTHWLYLQPSHPGGGSAAWSCDGLLAAASGHLAAVLSPACLDGPRQFAAAGAGPPPGRRDQEEEEEGAAGVEAEQQQPATAAPAGRGRQRQRQSQQPPSLPARPTFACQPDDPDASAALNLGAARRMVGPQRFGGAAASAGGGGEGAGAGAGPLPSVRGVAWSPLGGNAASGGGCLLATVSTDHALRVFRAPPARQGLPAASAKWVEVAELSGGGSLRRALAAAGGWSAPAVAAAVAASAPEAGTPACPLLYGGGGGNCASAALRLRGGGTTTTRPTRGARKQPEQGPSAAAAAAETTAAAEASEPPAPPPAKRSRGARGQAQATTVEVKVEEEQQEQQEEAAAGGKRRRGQAAAAAAEAAAAPPMAADQPQRRGRGRPPKSSQAGDSSAAAAASVPATAQKPTHKSAKAATAAPRPSPPPAAAAAPPAPPLLPPATPALAAALRALLTPGARVEVENDEEGLLGCWFGARVVAHAPDPLAAAKAVLSAPRKRGRPRKDEAAALEAAREAAAAAAGGAATGGGGAAGGAASSSAAATATSAKPAAPSPAAATTTTTTPAKRLAAATAAAERAVTALVLVEYDELNEREEEGAPKLREWFPLPEALAPHYAWFAAKGEEEEEEEQEGEAERRAAAKAEAARAPPPQSGRHSIWRRPGFRLRPCPPAQLSAVQDAEAARALAAPGAPLEALIDGGWWAARGAAASGNGGKDDSTVAVTVWDQPSTVAARVPAAPTHVRRMLAWRPDAPPGADVWAAGTIEPLLRRRRGGGGGTAGAAVTPTRAVKRERSGGAGTLAASSDGDDEDASGGGDGGGTGRRRGRGRRSPGSGSGTPERAFSDDNPDEATFDRTQPFFPPTSADALALFEALDPALSALVRGGTRAARGAAPRLVLLRWLALREQEVPEEGGRLKYSKGRHLRGQDARRLAQAVAELAAAFGSALGAGGGGEQGGLAASDAFALSVGGSGGPRQRRRPAPALLPPAPSPFSSAARPAPRDVAAVPPPGGLPVLNLRDVVRASKALVRQEAIQSYDRVVRLRRVGEGAGGGARAEAAAQGGQLLPVPTGMGGRAAPATVATAPGASSARSWQGPAGLQGALLRSARRAAQAEQEKREEAKEEGEGEGEGEGAAAAEEEQGPAAAATPPPAPLDLSDAALPRGRVPTLDTWQGKYVRVFAAGAGGAAAAAAAPAPSLRVGFVSVSERPAANARRPLRLRPEDDDALPLPRPRTAVAAAPPPREEQQEEGDGAGERQQRQQQATEQVEAVPAALYDARRGFLEPLCVSWSPALFFESDGARHCYLAAGTRSGHVHFWRLGLMAAAEQGAGGNGSAPPPLSSASFSYAGALRAHAGYVTALSFAAVRGRVAGPAIEAAADGAQDAIVMATGCSDGGVRLWRLASAATASDGPLPSPPFACLGQALPEDGRPVTALDATALADEQQRDEEDGGRTTAPPPRLRLLVAAAKTLGTVSVWSSGPFSVGRGGAPLAPLLEAACAGGAVCVRPRAHGLGPATGVVINPHERLLHTSGTDGLVRSWPLLLPTKPPPSSSPPSSSLLLPAHPPTTSPPRYNPRSRGAHVPTSLREAQVLRCPVVGLASPPLSRLALVALRDVSAGASSATAEATGSGRMSFSRVAFATVHLLTPFGGGGESAAPAPVGRAMDARDVLRRAPALTAAAGVAAAAAAGRAAPALLPPLPPAAFWDVAAAVSRAGWARVVQQQAAAPPPPASSQQQVVVAEQEQEQQEAADLPPPMTGEQRRAAAASRRAVADMAAVGALALACAEALERPFERRREACPPFSSSSDALYSACEPSEWRGLQLGAALRRSALALLARRPLAGGGLPPGAAEAARKDRGVRAARVGLARGLAEAEMELVQRQVRGLLDADRFAEALRRQQHEEEQQQQSLPVSSPAVEALCDHDPRSAAALLAADWVVLAARHPQLRAHALLPRVARLYAAARLAPPLPPAAAAPPGRELNPLLASAPPPPDPSLSSSLPRVAMSGGALQAATTAAVVCGHVVKGEGGVGGEGEEDEGGDAALAPIVLPMPRCSASLRTIAADSPAARCVVCGRHYYCDAGNVLASCVVCGLRPAAPPPPGAGACAAGGAAQALETPAARVLPSAVFLPTLGA